MTEQLKPGGWIVDPDMKSISVPERVHKAFQAKFDKITGAKYELVFYCGSQVVSGLNYKIIYKVTTVTPNPVKSLHLADLWVKAAPSNEVELVNEQLLIQE